MPVRWPHYCNCLFWAWYRYHIRPWLLVRKRGRKYWRVYKGHYIKRPMRHGWLQHRMWSRDLTVFWGYTVPDGWHWRSHWGESWRALFYEGRVAEEAPTHSPEHIRRPRKPHAIRPPQRH